MTPYVITELRIVVVEGEWTECRSNSLASSLLPIHKGWKRSGSFSFAGIPFICNMHISMDGSVIQFGKNQKANK